MQPFANVLQNRCSYKFLDILKKICLLEPLFNKVAGLMACNFSEKQIPTHLFSCEYHKLFENSFFMEQVWWWDAKALFNTNSKK